MFKEKSSSITDIVFDIDGLLILHEKEAAENPQNKQDCLTRIKNIPSLHYEFYAINVTAMQLIFHELLAKKINIIFATAGQYLGDETKLAFEQLYDLPFGALKSCLFINWYSYEYCSPKEKGRKIFAAQRDGLIAKNANILFVDDQLSNIYEVQKYGISCIHACGYPDLARNRKIQQNNEYLSQIIKACDLNIQLPSKFCSDPNIAAKNLAFTREQWKIIALEAEKNITILLEHAEFELHKLNLHEAILKLLRARDYAAQIMHPEDITKTDYLQDGYFDKSIKVLKDANHMSPGHNKIMQDIEESITIIISTALSKHGGHTKSYICTEHMKYLTDVMRSEFAKQWGKFYMQSYGNDAIFSSLIDLIYSNLVQSSGWHLVINWHPPKLYLHNYKETVTAVCNKIADYQPTSLYINVPIFSKTQGNFNDNRTARKLIIADV